MIKLSDDAKKAYAKYVGPDGKLIIDDSLSDDMKETFQFFNDRGIIILEMNIDDESAESSDSIELLEEEDNVDESSYDDDSDFSSENCLNQSTNEYSHPSKKSLWFLGK